MSRKTLALLTSLLLITGVLLALALTSSKKEPVAPEQQQPITTEPSPTTPVAYTVLSMQPNPVTVTNGQGSVDVMINTDQNDVTAVQLELQYDPKVLSNVKVIQSDLFENTVVLLNQTDTKNGRISYAMGIPPSQQPIKGTGKIATITFSARATEGITSTELSFRPLSLVTAQGISTSVLKESTGTTINLAQ
jgi:hypothetical protein